MRLAYFSAFAEKSHEHTEEKAVNVPLKDTKWCKMNVCA